MTQEEYDKWNHIMYRGAAILCIVVALVTGCQSMRSTAPDTTTAGDTRSIAEHARLYWGTTPDKEVQDKDLLIEDAQISGYKEGMAEAYRRVYEACTTTNEFTIDGVRFGCMATRN